MLVAPVFGQLALENEKKLFPRSPMIDRQVYFWKKVYTEVSVNEGLLHDNELILPIYEKIPVKDLSYRQRERKVDRYKKKWKKKLRDLAYAMESNRYLSGEQRQILNLFYEGISPKEIRKASKRIRFQLGLFERFKKGISRSNKYLEYIFQVLREYKVPLAIAYLPHVESSFNIGSHSKSGAKGIWQFTRPTGREFMRVNSRVDERLDPFIASESAARLLKKNYDVLGTWPLALTAYNHGRYGIKKIVKKLGTTDLEYIIRHYKSRRFSFASKNFYAEFLAAWDVVSNYKSYFGNIKLDEPVEYKELKLSRSVPFSKLVSGLGFSKDELLALNPAIKKSVIKGYRLVPYYYRVKIPATQGITLAQIKKKVENHITSYRKRKINKNRSSSNVHWVTVRKGDSLFGLSSEYDVNVQELCLINGLTLNSMIYPGQTLRLPDNSMSRFITVRKGDSLSELAHRYRISLYHLADTNNINVNSTIYPGQKLRLPASVKHVVIVKPGDSLYSISKRTGVGIEKLIAINGLTRKSLIFPGQRLKLSL